MVNYKYFDLFWKGSVDKQWKIEYDGGVIVNKGQLFSESIELKESLCSETELRFGSCEASSFKFKIGNTIQPLMGKWLTVSVVLEHHEDEPFFVGKYKVWSDKVTADRMYREIVAYDAMYDIINSSAISWYNKILPNNDSKVTMKQFRTSFVEYFGLKQQDITLVNDDMIIEKTIQVGEGTEIDTDTEKLSILKESSLSGLSVINAICEINGCFGHIGRDGKFHYIYLPQAIEGLYPANNLYPDHAPDHMVQAKTGHLYPQNPESYRIDVSNYIECHWEDFVTKRITKLQIRQKENDIGAIWPDEVVKQEDNCYIIEDNFLVYGKGSEELRRIANNIFGKITDIVYRPFDSDTRGNPCLEVGDAIRIPTRYEIVESYILSRTLKGIQALRDSFLANGTEKYTEKVNSVSRSIIQLKGKTNTLERNVEKNELKINDVETGLSSRITQLVDSISLTVTNDKEGKTAEVKLYIKDGETIHEVTADKIDFTGLVSFRNLLTNGETVINGDNIKTGSLISLVIDNGNGTFHVDENGNMIANNATLWGNLYGNTYIYMYNENKSVHVPVFEFRAGEGADSSKIIYKFPSGGTFISIDEQEGAKINNVSFLEITSNIRLRGLVNRITHPGPDNEVHDVVTVNSTNWTNGFGMDSEVNTKTLIRGRAIESQTGITNSSDERLKNSFKPLDEFDDVYMDIPPCAFKYNNGTSGRYHFGAKAQNVKKALEKHGYTTQDFAGVVQMSDNPDNKDYCGFDDPMGLIYTEFTMWNMHMVQKLYKKVEKQQKEIDELKEIINSLPERM